MVSLQHLPKELHHNILNNFTTAKDFASFESLSPETRAFAQAQGWRLFVQRQFPGFQIPVHDSLTWKKAADSLTYLDRCWAKRAFLTTQFAEDERKNREHAVRGGRARQIRDFSMVLDASILSSSLDELLVVGAGEDVVSRRRSGFVESDGPWRKISGATEGYNAGNGDVTSVKIIDRYKSPEILVGRASGDLHLRRLDENGFRKQSRRLLPWMDEEMEANFVPSTKSFGWKVVMWTDWQPQSQVAATCQGPYLRFYNLFGSEKDLSDLRPVALYNASSQIATDASPLLRSCKFLNDDIVVYALGSTEQPLRWGKLRPEGFDPMPGVSFPIPQSLSTDPIGRPVTTVRAIERVDGFGGNVVLSSWDDGTIRLGDLRTPCSFDGVYRDRFHPYQASSSLLTFGTKRFVAGDNAHHNIRIFDYRTNDNCYQHTDALPCSQERPTPSFKYGFREAIAANGTPHGNAECNPKENITCNWHAESKKRIWQPDTTLFLPVHSSYRCTSLAKASDMSSSFYASARSTLFELTPKLTEDLAPEFTKSRKAPKAWLAGPPSSLLAMTETGVGLTGTREWDIPDNGVPNILRMDSSVGKHLLQQSPEDGKRDLIDSAFRLDVCWTPPGMTPEETAAWRAKWWKAKPKKNKRPRKPRKPHDK